MIRLISAVLVLAGILMSSGAYGQGGATGAISGVVVDTSGARLGTPKYKIIDTARSLARKVATNADGAFVAPLLPPGIYIVVVNKSGFSEAKPPASNARDGNDKVTISLKPGAVSEKVEISAQITSVENQRGDRAIAGHGNRTGIAVATQNYQQLLTLSSGAQSELNAAAQLGRGSVKLFVNGQREDNNNFLIEGISATDYNVRQASYVPLPNPTSSRS